MISQHIATITINLEVRPESNVMYADIAIPIQRCKRMGIALGDSLEPGTPEKVFGALVQMLSEQLEVRVIDCLTRTQDDKIIEYPENTP